MSKKTTVSKIDDLASAVGRLTDIFCAYVKAKEELPQEVESELEAIGDLAYNCISLERRRLVIDAMVKGDELPPDQ